MNLNPHRPWITPLVIGTFALMTVTGALMFFHLDSGLNKTAHEWLGWAMVAAVVLHLLMNVTAFKRYFSQPTGRWVIGACAVVLVASFVPLGGSGGKPPFVAPVQALAGTSLTTVAQVAGVSVTEVRARLAAAGIQSQNDTQSIKDLVGPDLKKQMGLLGKVFGNPAPAAVVKQS
jgi:hypothetical protein